MQARLSPRLIQQVGDHFAIAWNDGQETFLSLETMRRNCPCAGCGGEPDVMGYVERPEVAYTARSFELRGWQDVGGYALQPIWADGHSSGLYSFKLLQRLGEVNQSA